MVRVLTVGLLVLVIVGALVALLGAGFVVNGLSQGQPLEAAIGGGVTLTAGLVVLIYASRRLKRLVLAGERPADRPGEPPGPFVGLRAFLGALGVLLAAVGFGVGVPSVVWFPESLPKLAVVGAIGVLLWFQGVSQSSGLGPRLTFAWLLTFIGVAAVLEVLGIAMAGMFGRSTSGVRRIRSFPFIDRSALGVPLLRMVMGNTTPEDAVLLRAGPRALLRLQPRSPVAERGAATVEAEPKIEPAHDIPAR